MRPSSMLPDVLNGLSVHDGSMATSVARRRVLWRLAGAALLLLAGGLLVFRTTPFPWRLEDLRRGALLEPFAACACALDGIRLLRLRRHSRTSRLLRRGAIVAWTATAFVISPLLVLCWVPYLSRRATASETD